MQKPFSALNQAEIEALSQQSGSPIIQAVACGTDAFWSRQTSNRTKEVCMVIRRPNGRILTFTKTFYPRGIYRLLTGGVEHQESILDALHRELYEETGLQTRVRRLLAVVSYTSEQNDVKPVWFTTVAFLVDEVGGTLSAIDPNEQVAAFREVEPEEIFGLAEQLEHLPNEYSEHLAENWQEWGRFRAIIHRVVGRILTES